MEVCTSMHKPKMCVHEPNTAMHGLLIKEGYINENGGGKKKLSLNMFLNTDTKKQQNLSVNIRTQVYNLFA